MTQLGRDDFQRADVSGSWGIATDGNIWNRFIGGAVMNLISFQGRLGPVAQNSHLSLGSGVASEINIEARVASGDNLNFIGVLFRASSDGTLSGYRVGLFNQSIAVDRFDAGARVGLGSVAFAYGLNENVRVRVIGVGGVFNVYAWKDTGSAPTSPTLTFTDTSYASGWFGVSTFLSNDFTYVSDFTVSDNQDTPPPPTELPLGLSLSVVRKSPYDTYINREASYIIQSLIEKYLDITRTQE